MAGGVGHMGGLTNPRPWRGRCRAGFSNTGGPPLPRKRAPCQKNAYEFDNVHTKSQYRMLIVEQKMPKYSIKIRNNFPVTLFSTGTLSWRTVFPLNL